MYNDVQWREPGFGKVEVKRGGGQVLIDDGKLLLKAAFGAACGASRSVLVGKYSDPIIQL